MKPGKVIPLVDHQGKLLPRPAKAKALPELMTVPEAVEALRISRAQVYELIHGHKVVAYPKPWRITVESALAWLESTRY